MGGAQVAVTCKSGGPHYDFKGTNINMRKKPGGKIVGTANHGDCAYWNALTPGPKVKCPNGKVTDNWEQVLNKRINVYGWVSDCFLE